MAKPIIIMTTTGSEQQAMTIAEELMQQELVSSVNILPTMRTVYRFKGQVFDDEENLLILKTSSHLFDEVASVIQTFHTYEIPEIMSVDLDHWTDSFGSWLFSSVRPVDQSSETS
jgi:periplasmic divalent cation tolerance protein